MRPIRASLIAMLIGGTMALFLESLHLLAHYVIGGPNPDWPPASLIHFAIRVTIVALSIFVAVTFTNRWQESRPRAPKRSDQDGEHE